MKRIIYLLVIATSCFLFSSFIEMNEIPSEIKKSADSYSINNVFNLSSEQMNSNNIKTWYRNNGSFNRNPTTDNSGFEWPLNSAKFARYASGLWLGAITGGDTLVSIAEYSYEYVGGNIPTLGGPPQGQTDPNYKIYNISTSDTSQYQAWRTFAAPQGAYLDNNGNPFLIGAQTQFYAYTDGYASAHGNRAGSTAPLNAVILQTNWSFINVNLRDVIFTEYRIINRSNIPWNNAYISIWTDDDLGTATDDAIGIDTNLKLGYTYNFNATDDVYGSVPPAVGFLTLRNPIVPSFGDTVRYYSPAGSNNLVVKPNFKQVNLSSFNYYTNGDPEASDPANYRETFNNLQGKKSNGTYWINPVTNQPTVFPYSGNPQTGTGWIMNSGDDRRFMMNFGPLTMNPNDTQSVIVAQLITGNSSNLANISNLKSLANYVRGIYNTNFQSVISAKTVSTEIPDGFGLKQNYPNPFNPTTKINYELRVANYVSIIVYDVLGNEVKTLLSEKQSPGIYQIEFDGSDFPSGTYYYRLTANGFTETKKMLLLK